MGFIVFHRNHGIGEIAKRTFRGIFHPKLYIFPPTFFVGLFLLILFLNQILIDSNLILNKY